MSDKRTADAAGRYAYEGLDRVLHEKARLGIMTSLATRPAGLSFNELKQLCALTDGNLNRHLDVLHRAGRRYQLPKRRQELVVRFLVDYTLGRLLCL